MCDYCLPVWSSDLGLIIVKSESKCGFSNNIVREFLCSGVWLSFIIIIVVVVALVVK